MGMVLLAIVWWCAHKLIWDCTLIDDNEDASGSGLLQSAAETNVFVPVEKKPPIILAQKTDQKKKATPHSPGLWVVYFSLAALPLFGIGQVLLPRGDLAARHAGFAYLFVYMAAAFGFLLATSFLGLRRYLRQRYISRCPPSSRLAGSGLGRGVAAFVLIAALLLPRPGAGEAWMALRYQVDYRLHQASDYAMRFSPHGSGKGRAGNQPSKTSPQNNPNGNSQPDNQSGSDGKSPGDAGSSGKSQSSGNQHSGRGQNPSPQQPQQPLSAPSINPFYNLFKWVFLLALALLVAWWVARQHSLILQAIRSIIASIADFFRNLFGFRFSLKRTAAPENKRNQIRKPFSTFHNPFQTGGEQSWTQAQLILYTYDGLRAWAAEQGIDPHPEHTAREFCMELGQSFPQIHSELTNLSILYGRTAYGMEQLENQNLEPLKELWRYFYTGAERKDLIAQS